MTLSLVELINEINARFESGADINLVNETSLRSLLTHCETELINRLELSFPYLGELVAFKCYQDGKPCCSFGIRGWNQDTFNTMLEAEMFCALWAYPCTLSTVEEFMRPMELNIPIDMGMYNHPVLMEIREHTTNDQFPSLGEDNGHSNLP